MKETRFGQLLGLLSKKELEQFAAYAQFDVSQQREKKLLDFIMVGMLCGKHSTKEKLYPFLGENAGERQLTKVLSKFTAILEGYIAARQLTKKKQVDKQLMKYRLLMDLLLKPQHIDLFKGTYRKAERYFQEVNTDDARESFQALALAHEVFFHPHVDWVLPRRKEKELAFNKITDLIGLEEGLHKLLSLQYTAAMLSAEQVMGTPIPLCLKDKMETISIDPNSILSKAYKEINFLYLGFVPEKYLEVEKMVVDHIGQIPAAEQDLLLRHLININAHAVRRDRKFLANTLQIYEQALEIPSVLENIALIKVHLLNFVQTACSLGRTKDARSFLAKNVNKLPASLKSQVATLCSSTILIAEKEYQSAFILLRHHKFSDIDLKFISRTNRLMACYDWDMHSEDGMVYHKQDKREDVFLLDELESFRAFLTRANENKKNSRERIVANQNFGKILMKMMTKRMQLNKQKAKETLLQKVAGYQKIVCRNWLIDSINKL